MSVILTTITATVILVVAIVFAIIVFTGVFGRGLKTVGVGFTRISRGKFNLFGDPSFPCVRTELGLLTVYDLPPSVIEAAKEIVAGGDDTDTWVINRLPAIEEYKIECLNKAEEGANSRWSETLKCTEGRLEEKTKELHEVRKENRELLKMVEETKKLFNYKQ